MTRRHALLALLAYAAVAFAYFGVHVAAHPGRAYVGYLTDPELFIWSFAWWPHAIGQGENPFVTHAVWAPQGLDLAWSATAPGLALAFAPVTLLVGPVVAYNLAAVLLPALAAWTAFLLCHDLTRALWPSLAGGYLFGFSAYMLGHELGHLDLTAVFGVPLVALVLVRFLRGALGRRGLVVRLAPLLAAELWLSAEVSFTLALALVLAALLARRLRVLLAPLAAAYALAAALAAPLAYYLLSDFRSGTVNGPGHGIGADAVNLVVPTRLVLLGGHVAYSAEAHFPGNVFERGAYVGAPALLAVLLLAPRFLRLGFAVATLLAFGSWLHVDGRALVPLPWRLVSGLPLFDNVVAARFTLYGSLAAAVAVALVAAASRSRWLRVGLPALCVALLVPDPRVFDGWHTTPAVPAFFADGAYRSCLAPGENVIALPYGAAGDSTLWQVRAAFWFRQAGGYVTPEVPRSFARYRAVRLLETDSFAPGLVASVRALARAKGVGAILLDARRQGGWLPFVAGIARPVAVGGVLLYPLGRRPAGCGQARSRQ